MISVYLLLDSFATNFRFATFTFMKHESRELNDFWNINVQKLNE